ncbi:hypothetical protein, partial [uncultured Bilophila sp.]|uniref:hypothetical protein n=1 Tax=uncultured Bilophila sp. TaxID=529385 RepID=UPI0026DD8D5A
GKPAIRDSIKTNVFGRWGMGFGEGGGKPFSRRVPSPFPNFPSPLLSPFPNLPSLLLSLPLTMRKKKRLSSVA